MPLLLKLLYCITVPPNSNTNGNFHRVVDSPGFRLQEATGRTWSLSHNTLLLCIKNRATFHPVFYHILSWLGYNGGRVLWGISNTSNVNNFETKTTFHLSCAWLCLTLCNCAKLLVNVFLPPVFPLSIVSCFKNVLHML